MTLWQLAELQPPALLGFVRDLLPPEEYIGDRYLTNRTVNDIAVRYLLGSRRRPVMAHVIGYDAETPIGQRRRQVASMEMELPPIKRQERVSETEIIRYMQPRSGTDDQNQALDDVYDQIARLVDGVFARVEWLRMQALSEDVVLYSEDGVIITFDFGVTGEQQIDLVNQVDGTGASVAAAYGPVWINADGSFNSANSTPISDLMRLTQDTQDRTGSRYAEAIMAEKSYRAMVASDEAKSMVFDQNAPNRPLLPQELNGLLAQFNLPRPVPYDVRVGQEQANGDVVEVRTMASNKIALVPQAPVGQTLWGPTAESRLQLPLRYQRQGPGIWAQVQASDEPPAIWTKVAAVAFPTMPDVHLIGQMKVAA